LPSGLPNGTYSLYAIANGIASTPVSFTGASITGPTVVNSAAANPSPVTGTTTNLSALGADAAGEGSLTYTWAVTRQPAGAATPVFSFDTGINNGTNGAKNATATFYLAGAYTFTVTLTDPNNQTASSSVNVTVSQALSSISVSPANVTLADRAQQQFQAVALDQFSQKLASQPTFAWSIASGGVGSINSSGQYTAPNSGTGSATVQAKSGNVTGLATVMIQIMPPLITQAASSNSPQNTVTGTQTQLQVKASDPQGQNLTYAWAVTMQPTGAQSPAFNNPNSNNTNVTFYQAGNYTFPVTVTNTSGLSRSSSVNVTVAQTVANLSITPGNVTLAEGATQQFTAAALDQFGNAMASQPTFTWQVNGGGTISSTGLYTAPSNTGNFQVKVSANGQNAQANVTVTTIPAAPSNLTAKASLQNGSAQVQLQWNNNSNNQSGFAVQRSSDGGATWTTIVMLPGNPNNYTDTSVGRGTTYIYRVYAYNPLGNSPFSNPATLTTPS
jgi:hypothetical protein